MDILALAFDTLGSIFIAFAALSVHHRVLNRHKIDRSVETTMRKEQVVGILGVVLVILGFIIQLVLKFNL